MKALYTPEITTQTLWAVSGNPRPVVWLWLAAVNILAFALMGSDKARAKKQGARRIPERRLFLAAALGGSAVMYAAMRVLHHKTLHRRFMWGLPALFFLRVLLPPHLCRPLPLPPPSIRGFCVLPLG